MTDVVTSAREAGSEATDIRLGVSPLNDGWRITATDRGKGMSRNTLANAPVAFYSIERNGWDLGSSLCLGII